MIWTCERVERSPVRPMECIDRQRELVRSAELLVESKLVLGKVILRSMSLNRLPSLLERL